MAKTLLFLETSDVGARYTGEAAKRLGFEPVFLINPQSYQADTRAQLAEYRTIACDSNSADDILKALSAVEVSEVAGVTTFLDSRLVPAFEVAQRLGVNGLDPAVVALKDKGFVSRLMEDFSPPTVRFHRTRIPMTDIRRLIGLYGRVVLKPTQTAGGVGNLTIGAEDVNRIEALIEEVSLPSALDEGRWVAQAFCEGPLVSVEGYIEEGHVHVLGFSGRKKVGLTESQINFPDDENLSRDHRRQCESALEQLASRSGICRGYFHVEFILHAQGAKIIDANVGRLGGGSVGEQIADSFGIDPIDVYVHVIQNSIFPRHIVANPFSGPRVPTLGVLYGVSTAGNFEDLELPRVARLRHTQILDAGQKIPEMGVNNWSWVGIVSGPTHVVENAVQYIRIRNNGEWQAACY